MIPETTSRQRRLHATPALDDRLYSFGGTTGRRQRQAEIWLHTLSFTVASNGSAEVAMNSRECCSRSGEIWYGVVADGDGDGDGGGGHFFIVVGGVGCYGVVAERICGWRWLCGDEDGDGGDVATMLMLALGSDYLSGVGEHGCSGRWRRYGLGIVGVFGGGDRGGFWRQWGGCCGRGGVVMGWGVIVIVTRYWWWIEIESGMPRRKPSGDYTQLPSPATTTPNPIAVATPPPTLPSPPRCFMETRDDHALVEKFCLEKYKFSHGDVVVFHSPSNHKQKNVKKITALPGDWINITSSYDAMMIPEGHCWVEGDNPACSMDSGSFGPIPLSLVCGQVTHVVWPPHRVGEVDRKVTEQRLS
ncbi:mitochondrial inner membrane protease subunit 2 [Olea europaea subsp. europaea]|uniref:Mitochondrial inner membrane protease subunit 2 n=1 Tax=Olea europaea subsp. europaea TaxID=158383 RepID=A0A8S0TRH0_OLEEU|nr:mitochondrial inner membrane protease subunit 2 [Olea europaea subsp. europaea]